MIQRAEKARRSIEALINATRKVADSRRAVPVARVTPAGGDLKAARKPDPLGAKIDSLTEAVRKARGRSTSNMPPIGKTDSESITTGPQKT